MSLNDYIETTSSAVRESGWPFANVWLNGTEDESGWNRASGKEPPSTSPSPTQQGKTPRAPLRALVVEDNLPDALFLQDAIRTEALPLEIHVVSDGEQAMDFMMEAERNPSAPCPDVVLLDLNLPKIDGFEVLRKLRANPRWKDLLVLVVTSSDSPSDRREAEALGVRCFKKPISYGEFMKIGGFLRQFLSEHGLM